MSIYQRNAREIDLKTRVEAQHQTLEMLTIRQDVFSGLMQAYGDIYAGRIAAWLHFRMGEPDAWWRKRRDWTLGRWKVEMLNPENENQEKSA